MGVVVITASGPGFANATSQAQVTATLTYAPSSLSVGGGDTQNFTLTLSGNAPANGINVVVNSSNPAVATVPQQVTFLPGNGNSTVTVPVTGVAAGTVVIHVNASPFIPDTTANVTVLSPGVIGLPTNLTVG